MPTNLTDVDTFTATIAVPASADARTAASVQTPFQSLANRTAYLKERLDRISGVWEDAVTRIPMTSAAQPDAPGSWSELGFGKWQSEDNLTGICIPLDAANFPHGCTVTAYSVRVNPGAARTGSNKMEMSLQRKTAAGVVSSLDFADDDGTTNEQTIPSSGLSFTLDRATYEYFIYVTSGHDGGTNKDTLIGASVTRTLP